MPPARAREHEGVVIKVSPLTKPTVRQSDLSRCLEETASPGKTLSPTSGAPSTGYDLVCFSHLRWDFVWQRPQHLLSRFAREGRVFFLEEPIFEPGGVARLELSQRGCVWVGVPHLPEGMDEAEVRAAQVGFVDELLAAHKVRDYVLWYYTPMALPFSRHLTPLATVYDCMDELSAFRDAPTALELLEQELLRRADLMFTGGQSLFEAKRHQHRRVYAFPSSIDREHFVRARGPLKAPADQVDIPRPRLGFYGVIDERMDVDLVTGLAETRPDWQIVMVGPVVKIDPESLPRRPNIHYLGGKTYDELPAYLSGWEVALMPFARNESTRFISPTKTPEYLAAGRPVVSTSIRDVVRPYAQGGLVQVGDTVEAFVAAIEAVLRDTNRDAWLREVDSFLARTSWNRTWKEMARLIGEIVQVKQMTPPLMGAVK